MHQNKVLKEFRFENEAKNYIQCQYIRELQGNKPLKCFLCDSDIDNDDSYFYYNLVSGQYTEHPICFHCSIEQEEIFQN